MSRQLISAWSRTALLALLCTLCGAPGARSQSVDSVAARLAGPRRPSRSQFAFTAAVGRQHDDNVLQLTKRNLERFATNPGAPRFLIPQVADMSTTFEASGRMRGRPLHRRETRLGVDLAVIRFDHDDLADWEQYGVQLAQELTATKRRLLTLELYGNRIPSYYLGEITDLDSSVALGRRVRSSLTYKQTRLGIRLRQATWGGRLELSGALEHEHRDYNARFAERDNDDDQFRIAADLAPFTRWPASVRVAWERGDRNAKGDLPETPSLVDTDISYDHEGVGVTITLPWGRGPWRGRADATYAPEIRRYTTTDKFDVIRFGRENHRREVGVRVTQRVWGPFDALVTWSRLTSRAEFNQGITFPAAETNFAQEQVRIALRGRWEIGFR